MERAQGQKFADLVRRGREARGLSIRKAAEAGGISDTTWRRLEDVEELLRYEPRPATLRAIATGLRVRVDQVYHWAGRTFDGISPPKPLGEALEEAEEHDHVPAALSGAWSQLTEEERQRVLGYVEALREKH